MRDGAAALAFLGVDPATLPPAPPQAPGWTRLARDRVLGTPRRCVHCGGLATVTWIADAASHGPRWVDACTPDYVKAVKSQRRPESPLEETLDVIADAMREAGVELTVITEVESCVSDARR